MGIIGVAALLSLLARPVCASWYDTPPSAAVDVASVPLLAPQITVLNTDVAVACGLNNRVSGSKRMVQCVGIKLSSGDNGPTTAYVSSIINITSVRPEVSGGAGYPAYNGMDVGAADQLSIVRMSSTSAVVCNDELLCDTDPAQPAPTIAASRLTNYCPPEWVGYIRQATSDVTNKFPGPHRGKDRCKALVWNAATNSLSMGPAISYGERFSQAGTKTWTGLMLIPMGDNKAALWTKMSGERKNHVGLILQDPANPETIRMDNLDIDSRYRDSVGRAATKLDDNTFVACFARDERGTYTLACGVRRYVCGGTRSANSAYRDQYPVWMPACTKPPGDFGFSESSGGFLSPTGITAGGSDTGTGFHEFTGRSPKVRTAHVAPAGFVVCSFDGPVYKCWLGKLTTSDITADLAGNYPNEPSRDSNSAFRLTTTAAVDVFADPQLAQSTNENLEVTAAGDRVFVCRLTATGGGPVGCSVLAVGANYGSLTNTTGYAPGAELTPSHVASVGGYPSTLSEPLTAYAPLASGRAGILQCNVDQGPYALSCGLIKATSGPAVSAASTNSLSGDPHLRFANGGEADFRGRHNTVFALLAAPRLQTNILIEERDFIRWGGQLVHGSFVTQVFLKVRGANGEAALIGVRAGQPHSFRVYASENINGTYYNTSSLAAWGVEAVQMRGQLGQICRWCFFMRGAGWEVTVNHRRIRKQLIGGKEVNKDSSSRLFLDTAFRVLDTDPALVKRHGASTLGRIAPHGLLGQGFDGSKLAVSGKVDTYQDGPEFTTSAQGEGAIEGVWTEYIMPAPFSTDFKFSRFDAHEPIAARNITMLSGTKSKVVSDGLSASTVELHGVEATSF